MSYLALFLSFLEVGAFSIGGGYAALPLIQNQVVNVHHWLTMSEFTDLTTISQMTPGPIAINAATFVGIRIAGIPGAIIATLGCILPSIFIVSILAFLYERYREMTVMQNILGILRPTVVALIGSAGLSILLEAVFRGASVSAANLNLIGIILFAAAFLVLRKWKCNPILVMSLCGIASLLLGILKLS